MNRTCHSIAPGLVADRRRALWLEAERTLVVADLHLGYAWAHRQAGQLLPISAREDTTGRLSELQRDYQPREIVLLGDIVHRAVPVPELERELGGLIEALSPGSLLTLVRGNHDWKIEELLARTAPQLQPKGEARIGPHLLVHGDGDIAAAPSPPGYIVMGHEHPFLTLDDEVASAVRCPCFLVADTVLVLPAFSRWAAGGPISQGQFMSPIARRTVFTAAVAIVGEKLLRVPLPMEAGRKAPPGRAAFHR